MIYLIYEVFRLILEVFRLLFAPADGKEPHVRFVFFILLAGFVVDRVVKIL